MARRRKQKNVRGGRGANRLGSDSLFSYRMIVGGTVAFCIVALLGMASHPVPDSNRGTGSRHSTIVHSTENISDTMLRHVDAILVLGGGRPTSIDEPPVYVKRRCDDAAALVKRFQALKPLSREKQTASIPILCLSAGTAHLPQLLASDGLPIWESASSAAYLAKAHGIEDHVYVETTSYDTIGNAFFARTSHTDINGWRRLLVITNDFHMNRTMAIFNWIFGLSTGQPLPPQQQQQQRPYELHYLASPDVGLTSEAVQARRDREHASLVRVHEYAQSYTTLAQVYHFLTTQHGLYTSNKLIERASTASSEGTSDLVKKSYGSGRRLQAGAPRNPWVAFLERVRGVGRP